MGSIAFPRLGDSVPSFSRLWKPYDLKNAILGHLGSISSHTVSILSHMVSILSHMGSEASKQGGPTLSNPAASQRPRPVGKGREGEDKLA